MTRQGSAEPGRHGRPQATGAARTGHRRLTVEVLGPLVVSLDGRKIELTTGRCRTLLTVLAINAGRAVSVRQLAAAMWDEHQPVNPRRTVQTHVTRLRAALGAELVATVPAGYRLDVDPEQVDALTFVRSLDSAQRISQLPAERARLVQALTLWRGTPFDGTRSAWLEETEQPRLTERYLAALERRIDIDIALGDVGELTAELSELTAKYPLRESLWIRQLVALDRCGRRAEALTRYEIIRTHLAENLGVDPGPRLRHAYADLLAGRPVEPVYAADSEPITIGGQPPVPRQLPPDIDVFTGRAHQLDQLTASLSGGRRPQTAIALVGGAGVGKTALAVHWAHRVADRYPDGQLYVNLRGFDAGEPLSPAEAVRGFLHALQTPHSGIPADERARLPLDPTDPRAGVPADPQAQIGLYRSLLVGKRMLVVLDNARNAAQVRPLLPGEPGCLVLITSRDDLSGLVATDAVPTLAVGPLHRQEARELISRRLGHLVDSDPAAVEAILTWCGGLPLALALVAARLLARPGLPLAGLATELGRGMPLSAVTVGDPDIDIRAVFAASYRTLGPTAVRLFRSLGRHSVHELTVPDAARLAGTEIHQVRPALAELTRVHLLDEPLPGHFRLHGLLRAYAAELAALVDAHQDKRSPPPATPGGRTPRGLPPLPWPSPAVVPSLPLRAGATSTDQRCGARCLRPPQLGH